MEGSIRAHPESAFAIGSRNQLTLPNAQPFRISQTGALTREEVAVDGGQRQTTVLRKGRGLTGQRPHAEMVAATEQHMDSQIRPVPANPDDVHRPRSFGEVILMVMEGVPKSGF